MMRLMYLFLGILAIQACGEKAAEQGKESKLGGKLEAVDVYVRYVEAKHELQAEVTFRTDTGTAELKGGHVKFMGQMMQARKFPHLGIQYRLTLDNVVADTFYRIEYTKADGTEHHIDMPMQRIVRPRVASEGGYLSKTKGGVLAWDGRIFAPEDALTCNFSDAQGQTMSLNHVGITRKEQALEIPSELLGKLEAGAGKLQLVKKWAEKSSSDSLKLFKRTEFYFSPMEFELRK